MPLSRYQIRNEFSLADPDLYRAADKDDPEALLEGVAMAGLVGVLRQLGDLAEFAAEIFHDLHEEVMATAARGHSLTIRVQQLEAELPLIENAFLSQTSQSSFFYNSGTDWHPNLRMDQNMVTQGDLPRFVMESYEECRGPPRLFLLDKFDVAGAGACLKRYTDPSFFKEAASSFEMTNTDFQREKRTRKAKKKGSRWRNGETPEVLPTSHAKLHQLFMEEERIETGANDSGRHVKLKRRLNGFPFDLKTGKSYMEKFLRTSSPEHKVVHEVPVDSSPLKLPASSTYETGLDFIETTSASADEVATHTKISISPFQSEENDAIKQPNGALDEDLTYNGAVAISTCNHGLKVGDILPTFHKVAPENEISIDGEDKREDSTTGYHSDDIVSEAENFVDALASMDSELDIDSELRARTHSRFSNREKHLSTNHDQFQSQSSDSQSIGNSTLSDDANSTSRKEVSSFSSGSPSTSAETAPLEGDTATMTEIREIQMCYSPVDLLPGDEGVASVQPSEPVDFSETSIGVADHHRQSYGLKPLSTSSLLDSALIPGISEGGTVMREDALVKPSNEMLSTVEDEHDSNSVAETSANQYMDASAPINFDTPDQTGGDLPPVVSADNQLLDEIHTAYQNVGRNIPFSANHSEVPLDGGDDDLNGDNSDLDHLNLSITSNPFTPQVRDEQLSTENKILDKLDGEVLDSFDNTNCLDNLSNHPTSHKDGCSPSSSAINYSINELDDEDHNISSGASVHLPNILEASEEEEYVKHDLLIASKEENAEDNCIKNSEDHIGSSNLSEVQIEKEPLDSASKIETVNTSLKFDETLVSEEENTEDNCTTNSDGHFGPSNLCIIQTVPEISGSTPCVLPLDTGEVGTSHSGQENLDEALSMKNDGKMIHVISDPDLIERDASSLSPCIDSISEEPAVSHARVTEADKLNAEGATASLASPDDYAGSVSVSSLDIKELQDDSVSSIGHLTVNGLQSENFLFEDDPKDSGASNEIDHHTVISPDLHEVAGDNHLQSEVLTLNLDKTSSMQLHLEQSSFNVDQKSSPRSSFGDVMGDASPLHNHPFAEHEAELLRDQLDNKMALDNGERILNLLPPLEQEFSCQSDQAELFGASSKSVLASIPVQAPLPEDKCEDELGRSVNPSSISVAAEVPTQYLSPKLLPQGNHGDASALPTQDCNQIEKEELIGEGEDISKLSSNLEKIQASGDVHQDGSFDASSETMLKSLPCEPSVPKLLPHGKNTIDVSEQYKNPFTFISPGIGVYPGADQINLEEAPPLPPLPPVEWRMGKFLRTSPVQERDAQNGTGSSSSLPWRTDQTVWASKNRLPPPAVTNESSSQSNSEGNLATSNALGTLVNPEDSGSLGSSHSSEKVALVTSMKEAKMDKGSTSVEENLVRDKELIQSEHQVEPETSLNGPKLDKASTYLGENLLKHDTIPVNNELFQPEHQVAPEINLKELQIENGSAHLEENLVRDNTAQSALEMPFQNPLQANSSLEEDIIWPAVEEGMVYGSKKIKLPRPRSPLIDAVAAHDKSKLRKVSDRVNPPVQKVDERDMLLEQIRNKSFNLKPTVATRPNIQVPQTNLRVAAILEKAKTIRQAFAGSDEEDDDDSWE